MIRCIQLARLGAGHVAPNPMVGAVLLCNNEIIGEGYHQKYGEAHAEVNCINSVSPLHKHLISKSMLFVSLEPCSHFGKTPPCVDLIIEKKIPHVVIGCTDSFEKVNGKGIEKLINAGVKVELGILEKECKKLNKVFFTLTQKKRPYIILKWAKTNDGFIATENGEPIKISNNFTNTFTHKLRAQNNAILVGYKTILSDNPLLTARYWQANNPTRVVIDMDNKLSNQFNVFNNEASTIIFNKNKDEKKGNVNFIKIESKKNIISPMLEKLYLQNITSLIVEGGATTLLHFINEGLWDEAIIINNEELIINNGIEAPILKNEVLINTQHIFSDKIQFFKNSINEFL